MGNYFTRENNMSFEWIELFIIGIIVIIIAISGALYKVKKQSNKVNKKSY